MPTAMIVDDDDLFLEAVRSVAQRSGLSDTICAASLEEATSILAEKRITRAVVDLRFEAEDQDGVGFLEQAREDFPKMECVLLTGFEPTLEQEKRLAQIPAGVIHKAALSRELLLKLLSPGQELEEIPGREETMDVGALRLLYEDVIELNDLLIEDMVDALAAIRDDGTRTIWVGSEQLTISDLRAQVSARSPLGIRLIKMHHSFTKVFRR